MHSNVEFQPHALLLCTDTLHTEGKRVSPFAERTNREMKIPMQIRQFVHFDICKITFNDFAVLETSSQHRVPGSSLDALPVVLNLLLS